MASPSDSSRSLPPALAQRFELGEILGKGAFGVVHRARQRDLDRQVVLKLVFLGGPSADPRMAARLEREARELARLRHPHVCELLEYGVVDQVAFLVFPDEGAHSLARRLQEGQRAGRAFPSREAARLLGQCLEGLGAIHAHGVVHRDLKPANLVLSESRELRIIDFGLVREVDQASSLTDTGVIVGTPAYMSPDQLNGAPADPRDDLYSVGVVFLELLTGVNPFADGDLVGIAARHMNLTVSPLLARIEGAPRGLLRVLVRLLAKSREGRPASAEEALAVLRLDPGAAPDPDAATRTLELPVPSLSRSDRAAARRRPRPSPRRTGVVVGVAAGALLSAALMIWLTGSRGALVPTPPGGDEVSVAVPADFDAELAAALAPEEAGRLPELEPGADPLAWRSRVRDLAVVRTFMDWLEQGGNPEDLAATQRTGLVALGELLAARGLDSPFAPALGWAPGQGPAVVGDELGKGKPYYLAGRPLSPLNRAAWIWVTRCLEDLHRMEVEAQALLVGRTPEGLPETLIEVVSTIGLWLGRGPDSGAARGVLPRLVGLGVEVRADVAEWLGDATAHFEAAAYAFGRAARVPGEDGELAALLFKDWIWQCRHLGALAVRRHSPRAALGGAPTTPAGWFVRGIYLYERRVLRSIAADPGAHLPEENRALREAFEAGLATPVAGPLGHLRVLKNFGDLGQVLGRIDDRAAIAAVPARVAAVLESLTPEQAQRARANLRGGLGKDSATGLALLDAAWGAPDPAALVAPEPPRDEGLDP